MASGRHGGGLKELDLPWNLFRSEPRPGVTRIPPWFRNCLQNSPLRFQILRLTITLLSPPDETPYTACSLYSLPTFTWQADGSSFTGYEIQFSKTASFDVIAASDKVSSTSVLVDYNSWKKVLLAPGIHATGSSTPLSSGRSCLLEGGWNTVRQDPCHQ